MKKPADLDMPSPACLYLINGDSLYELEHIDAISRKQKSHTMFASRRAECSLGDM
ncbi:hypothetical protein KCP78_11240 [Salmonella enterica subsp. enterica]|nr:hypothetical protein KCP78_11240 [Salmonella enterica subsp. enterica]